MQSSDAEYPSYIYVYTTNSISRLLVANCPVLVTNSTPSNTFIKQIFCLLTAASISYATPAVPTMFTEHQPNGMPITLQLKGDENLNWLADPKGYNVMAVTEQANSFLSSLNNANGEPIPGPVKYVYAAP